MNKTPGAATPMKFALLAVAAIALSACSSEPEETTPEGGVDLETASAEAAKLDKPEPGQYSMKVSVEKLNLTGAPEGVKEQIRTQMESGFANSYCLTPEEADKGFDEVYGQLTQDGQCQFSNFTVDDGTLDGTATCEVPGGTMTYSMKGKAWATGSDLTAEATLDAQGRQMEMALHMVQERTGDCEA